VRSVFVKKNQTARQAYIAALRAGSGERIAQAAEAAGIAPEQVVADAAILDRSRELIAMLADLPVEEKAKGVADKRHADATEKYIKIAKPLEEDLALAVMQALQAAASVKNFAPATTELENLFRANVELLDPATMPPVIRGRFDAIVKIEGEQAVATARLRRLDEAEAKLSRARGELSDIYKSDWPYNVPGFHDAAVQKHMYNNKPDYIAKAELAVQSAEREVEAAKAACKPAA
jgi:hypothetical protein